MVNNSFFLKDEDVENVKQRSEQLQIESNNPIDSVYKHILDAFVLLRYAGIDLNDKINDINENFNELKNNEVLIKNLKDNSNKIKDLTYHCLMLYRDIKEIKHHQDLLGLIDKLLEALKTNNKEGEIND